MGGVGMVGVVHATKAIDAIQRLIHRMELFMIPSVVDTVIFIDKGKVSEIYELTMSVKVTEGMTEKDLARPIIEVKDYVHGDVKFEIYTYGEQTVVMPIDAKPKYVNPYAKPYDGPTKSPFDKFKKSNGKRRKK